MRKNEIFRQLLSAVNSNFSGQINFGILTNDLLGYFFAQIITLILPFLRVLYANIMSAFKRSNKRMRNSSDFKQPLVCAACHKTAVCAVQAKKQPRKNANRIEWNAYCYLCYAKKISNNEHWDMKPFVIQK